MKKNRAQAEPSAQLNFHFPRQFKRFWQGLIVLVIVIFFGGFWLYVHRASTLPIQNIEIVGDYSRIPPAEIQQALAQYTNSGFFSVNLKEIQGRLLQLSWVSMAEVRKIWPNTLIVQLWQQRPLARWGSTSLMNTEGEVFTPKDAQSIPSDLPQFTAPNTLQNEVFQAYIDFSQMLLPLNLNVVGIEVSDRLSWQITLNNGIQVILGREHVKPRLERFIETYDQIINSKADQVDYVDLRYVSGMAVKWKKVGNR